jgi:hypothetical protein
MYNDDDFSIARVLVVITCVTVAIVALAWFIQGSDFFMYKYFAPRTEQVRRETFEQSKAYNEGTAQELRRMQLEYVKATPEQKVALASIILHQMAGYDEEKLPSDLREFLRSVKNSQGVK